MRSPWRVLAGALLATVAAFGWLSRPDPLGADDLPRHAPDPANGARLFHVGGCGACHGDPDSDLPRHSGCRAGSS